MSAALEDMAILRLPKIIELTGLSRSTIYQMMKDGIFPRSVSIGYRAIGWLACDIRAWLQAKKNSVILPGTDGV